MAKRKTSTPGDHLTDCLRAPMKALRRAAKQPIPMLETLAMGAIGLLGVGWAMSGVLLPEAGAFEAAVLGGMRGFALIVPLLVFVAATNALQAPGSSGGNASLKTSLAITATATVLPGLIAVILGAMALALPLFVDAAVVSVGLAAIAAVAWLMGVVMMTGVGHAMAGNSSKPIGVASAVGALLIVGFVSGLTWWILSDPPWARSESPWGFL
ncbi:MAG: hypothetical protein KDA24_20090 [Deltaproteobacteria bacterium]|nr:hypothetical protein [Deltaproteobacteria bacterium]